MPLSGRPREAGGAKAFAADRSPYEAVLQAGQA